MTPYGSGNNEDNAEEHKPVDRKPFIKELEEMINRHCLENNSDTPDFILAEYLMQSLIAFESAVKVRSAWWGHKHFDKPEFKP